MAPSSGIINSVALFVIRGRLARRSVCRGKTTLSFPRSIISFFSKGLNIPCNKFPRGLRGVVLHKRRPRLRSRPRSISFTTIGTRVGNERVSAQRRSVSSCYVCPGIFDSCVSHCRRCNSLSILSAPAFFFKVGPDRRVQIGVRRKGVLLVHLSKVAGPSKRKGHHVRFRLGNVPHRVGVRSERITRSTIATEGTSGSVPNRIKTALSKSIIGILTRGNKHMGGNRPIVIARTVGVRAAVASPISNVIDRVRIGTNDHVRSNSLLVIVRWRMGQG